MAINPYHSKYKSAKWTTSCKITNPLKSSRSQDDKPLVLTQENLIELDFMFESVIAWARTPKGRTFDTSFVHGLQRQFLETHSLTGKQVSSLAKIWYSFGLDHWKNPYPCVHDTTDVLDQELYCYRCGEVLF